MGASILYPNTPKNMKKIGKKLTGKLLQNRLFNRVWPETTITAEFAIKNCIETTTQTSKSSPESLIHQKSVIFLDFSRIFATQSASGLSIPYTRAIPALPECHPSL